LAGRDRALEYLLLPEHGREELPNLRCAARRKSPEIGKSDDL
jgi:hypothetical protein